MSPEHDVGLEVDPNADDHGNSGESDGFEVLMVVVQEEWSWFNCFSTTIDAVTFLFDSWPAGCRIREFSTAVHYGFDDIIFGVELIQDITPASDRGIGFEDEEFGGVGIVERTAIKDSLLEVVEGRDFGGVPARFPIVVHSSHSIEGLDTHGIIGDELAADDCGTE